MSTAPRCSRPIYVIAAVFLGSLGVHNFIAGRKKPAFIQLGMGTIGWLLFGIPPMLAALWALYEAFSVVEDGNGVPFNNVNLEESFAHKDQAQQESYKAA